MEKVLVGPCVGPTSVHLVVDSLNYEIPRLLKGS